MNGQMIQNTSSMMNSSSNIMTSNNNGNINISSFNSNSQNIQQSVNIQNTQGMTPFVQNIMHQNQMPFGQKSMNNQFQPRFPQQQHPLQPYQGITMQQIPPHMQQQQNQRKMGMYPDMSENQPHPMSNGQVNNLLVVFIYLKSK